MGFGYFGKDKKVFSYGDPGEYFYIILHGKIKVMI